MPRTTRTAGLMIAICSVTYFAESVQAQDPALLGTWKVESAKRAGKTSEDPVGDSVTFAGDTMTIKTKNDNEQPKLTIKTDKTKTPHEIDFAMELNGKKMTVFGIYRITGTKLELCMSRPGKERPKQLQSKEETQQMSIVAKKE